MARLLALTFLLAAVASASAAPAAKAPRFEGRVCKPPTGHKIADCRLARRGTPDLSRAAWRALRGKEVSVDVPVESIAANPAAGGARAWAMLDSLAQPMGTLEMSATGRRTVTGLDGTVHRVTGLHMRGRGCAASLVQQARFALMQIMVAPSGGTQTFVDTAALDQTTASGISALAAFNSELGGGTACAPGGKEISAVRKLTNPNVGKSAHARLSNGAVNSVDEYDAKPAFGNIVYFMSNTTQVHAGGITRGMVRVGTPVAKVDTFGYCDPSSDDTLTWRYWAIQTGVPARPRIYGWIPARCPVALKGRKPV
jgi:hypothetical protein